MKYSFNMVFKDFKRAYPDLWRRGTTYQPENFMSIIVFVPGDGKYRYEYFGNKLTLLERYLTPKQVKTWNSFQREERVREIAEEMQERRITQMELAERSGISRQSINHYITGKKTPKASTLQRMEEGLEKSR